MNKLDFAKTAISLIVGSGTTKIVTAIVKNNIDIRQAITQSPIKVTDKVAVTAGAMVLGAMAADASKKYTDAKVDEIVNWYNENFKKTTSN